MTAFGRWYNKTFSDPDGNFDHLPDWHKDDMKMAWDEGFKLREAKANQKLRPLINALKPFAKLASNYSGHSPRHAVYEKGCVYVYELRLAQTAIKTIEEKK